MVRQMAQCVQLWCADVYRGKSDRKTLILAGDPGTGKTHCLDRAYLFAEDEAISAYCSGFWDNPFSHIYCSWTELIEGELWDVFDDVCCADVAFVDDIGAETDKFKSGVPTERLSSLLNRRKEKFTMFTTNIHPNDWVKRWDPRVSDRLLRNSEVRLTFGVESWAARKTRICA